MMLSQIVDTTEYVYSSPLTRKILLVAVPGHGSFILNKS